MRVGAEPRRLRRLFVWLIVLGLLASMVGLTVWARQQDTALRVAEGRVEVAEARLQAAEASLTALAHRNVAATAVASPLPNEPELALRRALDLVFEAYKDPSNGRLKALSEAFSPDALSFERTEAEHLISGGLHIAGTTPYRMDVLSVAPGPSGETQIATHEVWTYDEVDAENRRIRCVREDSDQTYEVRRVGAGWLVQSIILTGTTRRIEC